MTLDILVDYLLLGVITRIALELSFILEVLCYGVPLSL
jgi:hypothetical protein